MKRTTLALTLALAAATAAGAADWESALGDIQGYTFGDSREPLTVVEDMVTEALNDGRRAEAAAALARVLATDATHDVKQFVCRQLAIAGTADEVEAISELLDDPETADMARYALATLDHNDVDDELIDELGDAADKHVIIGLASTLGRRQAKGAVTRLARLARNDDPAIAAAAATALGHIAGKRAIGALKRAERNAEDAPLKRTIQEALLLAGDKAREAGNPDRAEDLYEHLLDEDNPESIRRAAFLALVRTAEGPGRQALLDEALNGNDPTLQQTAKHYQAHYTKDADS